MPYRLNDFHLIWSSQFRRVSPSFTFSSKIPIRNIEVLFFSLSSLSSNFLPPFCHHLYTNSSPTVFYHSLTSFFLSFLTLVYVSNLLLFCSLCFVRLCGCHFSWSVVQYRYLKGLFIAVWPFSSSALPGSYTSCQIVQGNQMNCCPASQASSSKLCISF